MVCFRGSRLRAPTLHIAGNIKRLMTVLWGIMFYRGMAQLVARTAGGREAAGSSPVTPTMIQ